MKNIKTLLAAIAALAVIAQVLPAEATDSLVRIWKAPIIFNDGVTENVLYVGGSSAGTEGYDPLEDGDAYPGGGMSAYFYHPEWGRSGVPGGTDYYMSDIRSLNLPQTWTLNVKDTLIDRDVAVRWNVDGAKEFMRCEGLELVFTDVATGVSVKIAGDTSYAYYNSSTDPMAFTVTASGGSTLPAPQNLTSKPGKGQVVLRWDGDIAVAGYRVYRDGTLASGQTLLIDGDGDGKVEFIDESAPKGRDKKGESLASIYSVVSVGQNGCESAPAAIEVTR